MDRSVTPLLPPLREELRLLPASANGDGSPAWMIHDPVCNRFYRIGWLDFEMLARWGLGSPAAVVESIQSETTLAPDSSDLEALTRFLERHSLLRIATAAGVRNLAERASRQQESILTWLLHHYLFFRLPLARPQDWLGRIAPRLDWLYQPATAALIALLSLAGLLLAGRQWDSFRTSFVDNLSTGGLVGFAVALTCAKALHEFGHALTATRYGVRVAHMGVAMVVLWPMLYTDTSESWKLANPRQRLAIASAGMLAELALAGLATLAWSLVPDGPLRSALFFLATTSWVLTLAVNASPFMRFDGYFILSDLLDFPNLHERAGAQARIWLRRRLLGFDDPWPEPLPPRTRRLLVGFALLTWLYRFVVFLGIAWAVYAFFFKALGLFLMMVEITWFIARPAWTEIAVWKKRRGEIPPHRRRHLQGGLAAGAILLLMPWRLDVAAEGFAHAERQQYVYAPFPARLTTLHPTGKVQAGTLLASFDTPELGSRELRAKAATQALENRLSGLLDEENDGRTEQLALSQRLNEQRAETRAVQDEAGRLRIQAEFGGHWRDVDQLLRPGAWLGSKNPLGVLIDPTSWVVDAYVEQRQIERITPGAQASFLPQGSLQRYPAEVLSIETTRAQRLLHAMLDSRHGGNLTTHLQGTERAPSETLYRVRLKLATPPEDQYELRGQVRIEGSPRSLAWEGVKGTLAILVRESGF